MQAIKLMEIKRKIQAKSTKSKWMDQGSKDGKLLTGAIGNESSYPLTGV